MSSPNIEHEYKYTVDLDKFYHWVQPYITRGKVQTRVIRQWYLPERLATNGIIRIRETLRPTGELEATILTIKVPTNNPAVRGEFEFIAKSTFDINQFVDALSISQYCVVKDRWDITYALRHNPVGKFKEAIVDFFQDSNGSVTAICEVEDPDANWKPPSFIIKDVTADISYTNYARALKQQQIVVPTGVN